MHVLVRIEFYCMQVTMSTIGSSLLKNVHLKLFSHSLTCFGGPFLSKSAVRDSKNELHKQIGFWNPHKEFFKVSLSCLRYASIERLKNTRCGLRLGLPPKSSGCEFVFYVKMGIGHSGWNPSWSLTFMDLKTLILFRL